MGVKSLRLSELEGLPVEKRTERVTQFLSNRHHLNGEVAELEDRIKSFERLYETSSETMLSRLADGSLKETAYINAWGMLVELLTRVKKQS